MNIYAFTFDQLSLFLVYNLNVILASSVPHDILLQHCTNNHAPHPPTAASLARAHNGSFASQSDDILGLVSVTMNMVNMDQTSNRAPCNSKLTHVTKEGDGNATLLSFYPSKWQIVLEHVKLLM